ncbi:MAG: AgmX/PglI C-terminal domain-containing protein [Myxococcota bacterium]
MVTIGSAPECAIRLEDAKVAPRHAVLYVEGGRLMIADNGGTSGVLVNGQVIGSAVVSGLDDIRIGDFRLKVELMVAAPSFRPVAQEPPPPPTPSPVAQSRGDTFAPARVETLPSQRRDVMLKGAAPDARRVTRTLSEPPPPPLPNPDSSGMPAMGGARVDDLVGHSRARPLDPGDFGDEPPAEGHTERLDPDALLASPHLPLTMGEDEETARGVPKRGAQAKEPRGDTRPIRPDRPERTPPKAEPKVEAPPPKREDRAAKEAKEAKEREAREAKEAKAAAKEAARRSQEEPSPLDEAPAEDEGFAEERQAPLKAMADVMPSPPEGYIDDDEDEEDAEEREFRPAFSLLDNVVRDRFITPIKAEPEAVIEIIHYREGRLLDTHRVSRGDRFSFISGVTGEPFELLRLKRNGRARLFYNQTLRGNVVIARETLPLTNICDDQHKADKKGQLFAIELGEGDYAHIKLEGEGYLLRFVRSPAPPPVSYAMSLTREDRLYAGSASLGIVLMLVCIWLQALISPSESMAMEEQAEFAEVSLKELELEKSPEPTPEPVVTPEPTPEPPAPIKDPTPPKKEKRRPEPRQQKAPPPDAPPPKSAAQQEADSALAALNDIAPAAPNLSAKISNIAAVKAPTGTSKRFAISGPIGKAPAGEIVVNTSASGRDTTAAAKLLASSSAGTMNGAPTGRVRARVDSVPARKINTEGGSLSREEILKVVAAGIGDIQRCYERELMKSPGLEGKVVMDWVISPSGTVQSTRVRSSTLRSEEVTACVQGVIKGWLFPKPVGGSVTVTFPFAFRGQSF